MLTDSMEKRATELTKNPSMLEDPMDESSVDDLKVGGLLGLPSWSYSMRGSCQVPVAMASCAAL